MERRDFIKMAVMAPLAGKVLLDLEPAGARGIPGSAFPGTPKERCYPGPPEGVVRTTLQELFKVGPGPSSSHTLAPIRMANDFRQAMEALPTETMEKGRRLEARLFGSLSATGKGHRTDRAIVAGLLGQKPETCDSALMDDLANASKLHSVSIRGQAFQLSCADTIVWDRVEHDFPFANTGVFRLLDGDGGELFSREYYSIGGGFFSWKGQPAAQRGEPAFRYGNMTEFKKVAETSGKSLSQIMLANEMAIRQVGEKEVWAHLDMVLDAMDAGVQQGLREEGLVPAPFEFYRKAKTIYEKAAQAPAPERFLEQLSSYALAVSEGNAAGRLAVTAPTLGSAGTLPAVAYVLRHHLNASRQQLRQGLLAAGLVGLLCKTNASVAGAEVGCQGEIGVASAMAAAMAAEATGQSLGVTEIAAAMALEHHLGMSCDPVGGFVLIPCIERNAFGAVKAYNAFLIAKSEMTARHWEDLDRVISAMLETGRALPQAFKEMGTAGLGVTMVDC